MPNLPRNRWTIAAITLVLAAILLLTGLAAGAAREEQEEPGLLFLETSQTASLPVADNLTIQRSRQVEVDFSLLDGAELGQGVVLNLFGDATFTAVLNQVTPNRSGSLTWKAHINGEPDGVVHLVVQDGVMVGSITLPGVFYQVRYLGNGVHAVYQIDQSSFPSELDPIEAQLPEDAPKGGEPEQILDDGSTIDLMVVYTDDARAAAGGTTAIVNLINLGVSEMNTSLVDSGINTSFNLAHTQEVSYNETGNLSQDLGRIRNPTDGYLDNVHTLRNTYYADIVTLIVENGGSGCGIGYLLNPVSTAFESSAFNVTDRSCISPNYTFEHEIGHNMGARHDWYVDDTANSPYTYNHGHLNFPDRWRTIMSYNTECQDKGGSCTRLLRWSNPNQTRGGDPLGVPAGTSTSCVEGDLNHPPCDADNRLTLNNTLLTVANFRENPNDDPGPIQYVSHLIDDDTANESDGNGDGVVNCGEKIELYVTLANQGIQTVTGVSATISTSDPNVSFFINTNSPYPNIPGGGTSTNTNDFDFSVASWTPPGHAVTFDLNITADNGGPWTDSFAVPVACPDSYEQDNSSAQANPIFTGAVQNHNIFPVGDEDWVTFSLTEDSLVVLQTSGATGNTRMWLYDNMLSELEFDDDGGAGLFSSIDRLCESDPLPAGTYFVKVDEYGGDAEIPAYDLRLVALSCGSLKQVFLPLIARNFCAPVFADDFSDPGSGWPVDEDVNVKREYLGGEYRILVKNSNGLVVYASSGDFTTPADYIVAADVRNQTGVDGTYGLVFGLSKVGSQYYTFEIDPDGDYEIWKFNSGWTLLNSGFSPSINTGTTTNRLAVQRDGSTIRAYVNGVLVGSVLDSEFTGARRVGVIATSFAGQPNVDARFDDFVVYGAGCIHIVTGSDSLLGFDKDLLTPPDRLDVPENTREGEIRRERP